MKTTPSETVARHATSLAHDAQQDSGDATRFLLCMLRYVV